MKVAITGHTRGIGKAFTELFPDYIGFSKSNGYDITDPATRRNIVAESKECKIFINNAQEGFAQTELLLDLWDDWKFRPRTIINIGSAATEYLIGPYSLYRYGLQKKSLENASTYLSTTKGVCKLTYIRAGYIDTGSVSNVKDKKMDVNDFVQQVKSLIEIEKDFLIPMISFQVKHI